MSLRRTPTQIWLTANQNLVAKSIGELSYEQILIPERLSQSSSNGIYSSYTLQLASGVSYRFEAWLSIWDHLRVKPSSIKRLVAKKEQQPREVLDAGQFFLDAQTELNMTDIVLANFLEEMHSTLYSDSKILEANQDLSAHQLSGWDGNAVQAVLNGHPKILLNKGRMGWGQAELAAFAPESGSAFQLFWLAARRSKTTWGKNSKLEFKDVYLNSLSEDSLSQFERTLSEQSASLDDYVLIPTHPWQWERIISVQFSGEVALNNLIPLGIAGDHYKPQISIRTLSNVTRPEQCDLKLPISILNTSAVRGIPSRYIASAPDVAVAVASICDKDPLLARSNTRVLEEFAGVSYLHPSFSQLKGAPYRYQETLGAIWRKSVESQLSADDEIGVLAGSLSHQDPSGNSLIGAYIERSGLSPTNWLRCYFKAVVIPLYHLQVNYGLGLVAHGQNVILRLKNFVPHGMLLKDFQGDLRASDEIDSSNRLAAQAAEHLDKLPPHYLIHDLVTGHFVTVLRFVSEVMRESDGLSENEFYQVLSECICEYLATTTRTNLDERLNLLGPKTKRVLLNKVRFKIGYADSAERPLPLLGTDLANPLYAGTKGNENG